MIGTMIAIAARPPLALAAVLVGTFAIFHGYAHGAELPLGASALSYFLGFVVLIGGILAALWKLGVLASVGTTWTIIGIVLCF